MLFEPYPGEQQDLRWVTITLTCLAVVLLLARLTSTWNRSGSLGWEDASVVMSTIFLVLLAVMINMSTNSIDEKRWQFFWYSQMMYLFTNGFNKMAFLMLYYRIFATRRFRQTCIVLMVASMGWMVAFVTVTIFQCIPIHKIYDLKNVPGTCINFVWQRWMNAILNLVIDVTIFFLPLPIVSRLNMPMSSRIGLGILFSVGFFVCLITILRMATLPATLRFREPTWESAPANLWSFIEAAVGVICACLISLRNTIAKLWPKQWRSNYRSTSRPKNFGHPSHGIRFPKPSWITSKRNTKDTYPLESRDPTRGGRNETLVSHSLVQSESQERIIEGITVTTNVEVCRN
ncbi:hypothetical protein P153DRAFT_286237 [Dothidotthia symphoricarpi CBS 119687]|uniref:Rhodopsin domain-containing protein n=1 Tax=Dothidotthia symphoricarpi CBS 119687 TaxID=1392245 RepID=A0A6A6AIU7_9PLEO|nr:uncharacterized protein P153DRAFT_286237 [Dothidotthia symphoricarpi CBS 119687]KAF2131730.1 hypothetical protein P153DRAFT_286237 [Dothidotthia symphoricarpi CBS 119687]